MLIIKQLDINCEGSKTLSLTFGSVPIFFTLVLLILPLNFLENSQSTNFELVDQKMVKTLLCYMTEVLTK